MSNSMEKLFSEVKVFTEGMLVKGRILEVRTNEVLVDIGYKSEGVISLSEFEDSEAVKAGERSKCSSSASRTTRAWSSSPRNGPSTRRTGTKSSPSATKAAPSTARSRLVKGGLVVNVGVEAFLPASQIDVTTPKNLEQFVGNTYEFKVVKINQERQNIVLSRRELIEQERNDEARASCSAK